MTKIQDSPVLCDRPLDAFSIAPEFKEWLENWKDGTKMYGLRIRGHFWCKRIEQLEDACFESLSRLDFLMFYDFKLWKKLRQDLRSLYISGILSNPLQKKLMGKLLQLFSFETLHHILIGVILFHYLVSTNP